MKFKLADILSDKYMGQVFERPYETYVLALSHFSGVAGVWDIACISPEGGTFGYTTHYRGRGMMLSKDTDMKLADYSKIPDQDKRGFISSLFKLDKQDRL